MTRVGIAAYAHSDFAGSIAARGDEAIFEVVRHALDRAGLERTDVDSVINCAQDAYDGITISSGMTLCPSGAYGKPSTRIENGGAYALHQAVAKIRTGEEDCVVVSSVDAVTTDAAAVSNISQEPLVTRPVGLTYPQSFGLVARTLLDRGDATREDFARVASKNYRAAARNPHAHRRDDHDTETVLDAERVASPLTDLELAPISKGAVALVLVSEEKANEGKADPVWIDGVGLGSSPYGIDDVDDLLESSSLRSARKAAFTAADVTEPIKNVDIAEVFSPAAPFELLAYEALGLCEDGESTELLDAGTTDVDGQCPVNASGGTLATNPPNAGGLLRTVQATMMLDGTFDGADVGDPETAVVTDSDFLLGTPGRTDGVVVLRCS